MSLSILFTIRHLNIHFRPRVERLVLAGVTPRLAVVQIGDRQDSNLYLARKKRACESVGIHVDHFKFSEDGPASTMENLIAELNASTDCSGILLQLPVPPLFKDLSQCILPKKDVDGSLIILGRRPFSFLLDFMHAILENFVERVAGHTFCLVPLKPF
jgi:5,10-methylene-tetrahydrofolate dehydrogenase/methenyl tetrahydrofolate cyclohydrolase